MEQKFNVGDKVVRTGCSHLGIKKGAVYTVRKVNGNDLYLEELSTTWDTKYFELVEEEKTEK